MKKIELNIPEGIIEIPDPIYKISAKRILFISDLHFNFHDRRAIETAVNSVKGIDTVIIGGDMLDMYDGSKFNKQPDYSRMKEEIATAKLFLEYLRAKFSNARIIFLEGNHDIRLRDYIWKNATALEGLDVLKLENLLECVRYKVKYLESGTIIKSRGLHFIHGHEARIGGGINVARTQLLRALDNVVFGHFHKRQNFDEVTLAGKEFASWSVGCLCQLRPKFLPMAKWHWGFAEITIDGKDFEVLNRRILSDYRIV